jgi:DNA modification methylase
MGRPTDKRVDEPWTLHRHDARDLGRLLEPHSSAARPLLTTTVTSPPYGGLKDYGHPEQIGFGQPYEEYLEEMGSVFSQLHEHTRADGSLWLVADTYMDKGGSPRRLIPVPFDLAAAAEEAGWTLRDVIVWRKDRTLPWSNGTRLRNSFEYVLLLVKGPAPKYRIDRLRDHHGSKEWWVRFPERYNPNGKAPSNVWDIPIPLQGNWGSGELDHACPLPPDLVERLILLSSDEGDVVCDPFAGSGVVIAEAERLGRRGVGTEIVERHIDEFKRIVRPEILARADPVAAGNGNGNGNGSVDSARLLVDLRVLKLPVVLMRAAARRNRDAAWPLAALALPVAARPRAKKNHAVARLLFVVGGSAAQRAEYEALVRELAERPPASKFGVESEIEAIAPEELANRVRGRRIYLYRNGATSRALRSVAHRDLEAELEMAGADSIPPILSSLHVDVAPRSVLTPRPGATASAGDG